MSQFYPLANYAGYQFPQSSGGGGGLSFTSLALGSPSQLPPVSAVYDAASSNPAAGTIVVTSGDLGNIGSGTPDCLLWQGVIDASFDWQANSHIIMRFSCTAAPTGQYFMYLGAFDGTIGSGRGIYGSVRTSDGSTGAESMGSTPVAGAAADSFQNGGNFTCVFQCDGDNDHARDVSIRSESTNPNDFGRQTRQENPSSAGTGLSFFFALGTTTSRGGGTWSGVSLDFLAVPVKS